jgi:hypothetical protein
MLVCMALGLALQHSMSAFGEAPAFVASTLGGQILTFTVNPKTGTFTVWQKEGDDKVCAIEAGEGWQGAPEALKALSGKAT